MKKKTNRQMAFKIDGKKLNALFKEKGIVKSLASDTLGMNKDYFSQVVFNNKITQVGANFLERVYDIKLDDYKIVEQQEEEKPEVVAEPTPVPAVNQNSVMNLTPEEFSALIYKAMYAAVDHVWNGRGDVR